MNDNRHPFYRPLWIRVTLVALVATWTVVEWTLGGGSIWAYVATGMLAYGIWAFFITYRPDDPPHTPG
jgi:hypothetical protein